jgi:chromosome segregation ATPase
VVEDYDDLNNSLLNDEEQDISDTSLDRPAILAQSINCIRQLEENLNREKSLSSTLQGELANLKNQFECHKQQTDDRFRQQGQALKQYSEEAKVLNKEKARLEILLKERQALHEEENQRQRMQYQRLIEESKRSLNQGEQKLEEKMGEVQQLQKVISDMRSNMRATAERAREADQIIKELTCERDELEKELHEELDIKASLEEELEEIKRATGKVGGLQVSETLVLYCTYSQHHFFF